jgi:hypothetical protein
MSVDAILAALSAITNGWPGIATAWHVLFAGLLVVVASRAIPRAAAASMLAVAALSVAALAAWSGNPFNATVFLLAALAMLRSAHMMRAAPITFGTPLEVVAGMLLVAFGAVYPHFLVASSWTAYLYQAPLGLIPCPTMAAIAGVTLIADGFGSKAWSRVVGTLAAFYGLVGVLVLGVVIDVALFAGAVMLWAGPAAAAWPFARPRSA